MSKKKSTNPVDFFCLYSIMVTYNISANADGR